MAKHEDMHGPTARETQMLELQDGGKSAAEISAIMSIGQYYVEQRLFHLSMNDTAADRRFFEMVRSGTAKLGRAVNLAGGHR